MIRWLERWILKRADRREGDSLIQIQEMLIKIENGQLSAEAAFCGPAIKLFAAAAIEWFNENGGDNFATMEVTDTKTYQRFELTMKRAHGKTPGDIIGELRAEIAALKGAKP
jgi:hypothetical protein